MHYYSPSILEESGLNPNVRNVFETLSAREREVVRLYADGMAVSEIARKLGSSVKTVSTQKTAALRKLGLAREIDLFQFARTNGLSQLH